jgi:hypothetical protein
MQRYLTNLNRQCRMIVQGKDCRTLQFRPGSLHSMCCSVHFHLQYNIEKVHPHFTSAMIHLACKNIQTLTQLQIDLSNQEGRELVSHHRTTVCKYARVMK